ncbi:MAG: hypothetical protein UR26_C0006G0019 [candidate division TM6 bacterium GW2011_GWF2_32_72]|nr:MAG: hypothetical protein UR26_C0006G0019 [candidate division TM6 bacterium GW2011_GWF2_32_72]
MLDKGSWFFRLFLVVFLTVSLNASDIEDYDYFSTDDDGVLPGFLDDLPDDSVFRSPTPEEFATMLIVNLKAQEVLPEGIFLRTNQFVTRAIQDWPQFFCSKDGINYFRMNKWSFGATLFFNHTPGMYFTKDSSQIDSYVNFDNSKLMERITSPEFQTLKGVAQIPDLLHFFRKIKVLEWKLGFMFDYNLFIKNCLLNVKLPAFFMLRHYWLSWSDQKKLENSGLLKFGDDKPDESVYDEENEAQTQAQNKTSSDKLFKKFAKDHLLCDSIGVGDLRLSLERYFFSLGPVDFNLGLDVTIPTAWKHSGLIGEHPFKKQNGFHADFAVLERILEYWKKHEGEEKIMEEVTARLQDYIMDLGTSIMDHLGSNLLDRGFGAKTLSLGLFVSPCFEVHRRLVFKNKSEIEFFVPNNEKLFFLAQDQKKDYDRNWYVNSPQEIKNLQNIIENNAFLNDKFNTKFFPFVFDSSVWQGIALKSFNGIWLTLADVFDFNTGMDFWYKTKMVVNDIKTPQGFGLNLHRPWAETVNAYQIKAFGGLSYKVTKPTYSLILSLNGDKTFASQGIGKDFSIGLKLECNY